MHPALVFLLSVMLAGPVSEVRQLHRQMGGPCSKLTLKHRFGNVDLQGAAGRTGVVVDAVVRVTAGSGTTASAFAQAVELDVRRDGRNVTVATRYPDAGSTDPDFSYEVDIDVLLPADARVEVENSFGDLSVTGVTGGCRLDNRYGEVGLSRCGPCQVTGHYGNVRMLDSEGPQQVQNYFGNVVLRQVGDHVQVENRYGTVEADRLTGEAFINNLLGNVVARHGTGRLSIVNHLGDVSASVENEGLDMLEILSRRGRVELNLARGVPYRLDGWTRQGSIHPLAPVLVRDIGAGESVVGLAGFGGPVIRLDGVMSDFTIKADSPLEGGASQERR